MYGNVLSKSYCNRFIRWYYWYWLHLIWGHHFYCMCWYLSIGCGWWCEDYSPSSKDSLDYKPMYACLQRETPLTSTHWILFFFHANCFPHLSFSKGLRLFASFILHGPMKEEEWRLSPHFFHFTKLQIKGVKFYIQ